MINKKGQASVTNIILLCVEGNILFALMPTIVFFVELASNVTVGYSAANLLVNLVPFIFVLVWLISAIRITTPFREERIV